MNGISHKIRTSVILFPHSSLSEREARRIFSSFGPITIFQPWYMEPPSFSLEGEYRDAVKILNPPSHMKPGEGFKGLLSEYKTWIKQHRDKSRTAFLKLGRGLESDGNTTWEIREVLRGASLAGRETSRQLRQNGEEQTSLRWHLILHLARDMEEDRRDADKILLALQDKESPIKGLLGDMEAINPLTDVSPFASDPQKIFYPTALIIEAWSALFGGYLNGEELLLTFSRSVMDYALEARDSKSDGEKKILKGLSGKNVILMEDALGQE
jgi:hypothetical protein